MTTVDTDRPAFDGEIYYEAGLDSATMRAALASFGYVYVTHADADFDQESLVRSLGTPRPQYAGEEVFDLKPEPDMDDVYHSRNTRALVPHTEAYEYDGEPPRYLALWCIKPAAGEGGETTLVDALPFIAEQSAERQEYMRTVKQEWQSSEGLARKGVHWSNRAAMIEATEAGEIFRYSYNNVARQDEVIAQILEDGLRYFDTNHTAIKIERHGLLVWDNWRMMHSRTKFTDSGRHLRRMLIDA